MSTPDTQAPPVVKPAAEREKPTTPNDVKARLERGRKAMMKDATKRRLCQRFRRGDTYWYLDDKNGLNVQPTATAVDGSGKPAHRIRNRYDFIGPIVDSKVSSAMSRIPSYEANPSTTDPRDRGAADLAEKVLLYGYDKWRVRRAANKVVDLAIGGGGVGYAFPYFDPNVGPYVEVEGRWVGRGEIKILTLTGNQVYSEPGVDFEDSPWVAIERAWPIEKVKDIPGYIGPEDLKADASTSDIPTDRESSDNLVMTVEYFERPCSKYPQGRTMTFVAGDPVVDYRLVDPTAQDAWGPYPLRDFDGTVVDEPLVHRLVFRVDPETDRDLGLTWSLIDFERTIQDCYNKLLEWKNRCLNPQMKAPVNSLIDRPNDVPGAVRYYKVVNGLAPEWEDVPTAWADPLFKILDRAVSDMRSIAADDDFVADPNVAAATVNAVGQANAGRWSNFLGDLAEWYSRIGRHCLLLVGRHYTEPRLLGIRGRWGPENINDFLGSHLMGQADVRVYPESLAQRTRQQVQAELQWIQANWPGYIGPEVAIATLHGGTAEKLIESFELDLSRVNGIIQSILDGTVMEMPPRLEQVTVRLPDGSEDTQSQQVGSYMPSEVDSIPIWKKTFGDWMKTDEYMYLPADGQGVAQQIWAGIKWQETQQQQQAVAAQQAQAARLGMDNAAKPQTKGVPSQPGDGVSPAAQP